MVPLKDIARVVNGLSLVAKEAIRRPSADTLINGAILSATDAAGLTKGNLRTLEIPRAQTDNSNRNNSHGNTGSSVVYFDNHNRDTDKDRDVSESDTPPSPAVDAAVDLPVASTSTPDSHSQSQFDAPSATSTRAPSALIDVFANSRRRKPRERKVPSTPFSRAIGFAGLGAGLAWGTFQESAKRVLYGTPESENSQQAVSPFLSERNAERLALALCRMRGAALKLGQMLSIQDENLVPAPVSRHIVY